MVEQIEADLKKGSFVSIDGRITTRNYVDKNGQKKYVTEIVANDVVLKQKEN